MAATQNTGARASLQQPREHQTRGRILPHGPFLRLVRACGHLAPRTAPSLAALCALFALRLCPLLVLPAHSSRLRPSSSVYSPALVSGPPRAPLPSPLCTLCLPLFSTLCATSVRPLSLSPSPGLSPCPPYPPLPPLSLCALPPTSSAPTPSYRAPSPYTHFLRALPPRALPLPPTSFGALVRTSSAHVIWRLIYIPVRGVRCTAPNGWRHANAADFQDRAVYTRHLRVYHRSRIINYEGNAV